MPEQYLAEFLGSRGNHLCSTHYFPSLFGALTAASVPIERIGCVKLSAGAHIADPVEISADLVEFFIQVTVTLPEQIAKLNFDDQEGADKLRRLSQARVYHLSGFHEAHQVALAAVAPHLWLVCEHLPQFDVWRRLMEEVWTVKPQKQWTPVQRALRCMTILHGYLDKPEQTPKDQLDYARSLQSWFAHHLRRKIPHISRSTRLPSRPRA
jgi:hypothetical protein